MSAKCPDCQEAFMHEELCHFCSTCGEWVCTKCSQVHFRACLESYEEFEKIQKDPYEALGICPEDF